MIDNMHNNEKLNKVANELFIRERKLNISLVFITQSCFILPKVIRLNTTHCFYYKTFKYEIIYHQILTLKTFRIFTKKLLENQILLDIYDTLPSDSPLRFRINI